ncbi:MAG TPA: T9SS type A sorting domain-containing protein, partial [Bacteroidia bacterium]|nr:T9SS type A sorting domain-containing protein [Bacteroidia bacterium]
IRMIGIGNHPPSFVNGNTQSLTICESESAIPIDSLLAVIDTDSGQTETWSLTTPPSHGTAIVSYTTTSTGGILTPTGLTYTPITSYTGSDLFRVTVSDSIATAVVTINVTINTSPTAGIISGIDSVCPGYTAHLSETVSSGIWSTSSGTISTINSSGIATGAFPGRDTIIYTVINSCGIVSAIFPFVVGSYSTCHTAINAIDPGENETIQIFPNPNYGTFIVNWSGKNIDEKARFIITNMLGKKVKEFTATPNKSIELTLFEPTGVYFLTTITNNSSFIVKLLIQ